MPISRLVGKKPIEADAVRLKTWTGGQVSDPLITRDIFPEATDTYDIGSNTLLFRKGWLSELDAIVFAQQTVQLLGGWLIVGHGEGTVNEDVDTTETQIDFGDGAGLAQNDFVLFKSVGKVEYMQIGANVSGNVWNVTRNLDGTGANAWPKGTPYQNLGYDGDGNISLNANATPRISMSTQEAAWNSSTELIRIGDLNANWGYGEETYGVAIGEYGAAKANITIDVANGIRIRDHATTMVELTPAGVVNIGAQASNYVKISGGIVYFYNGATIEGSLSGTTWTLGEAANAKVAITPSAVTLYDANGADRVVITTGGVKIGDETEGEFIVITSSRTDIYGGGVAHISLTSAGTFWAGDTSATERIQWDTSDGLQIFNAGDVAVFKAPTSGDIQIVGTLEVTSPGEITAGAGAVTLDANGITIAAGTGRTNSITWLSGAATSQIHVMWDGAIAHVTYGGGTASAWHEFYGSVEFSNPVITYSTVDIDSSLHVDDGIYVGGSGPPYQEAYNDDVVMEGGIYIGGNVDPARGQACIENGTVPAASITNGVILYSEDVSASAELKVRDEAGNITTLSPHDFSLIPEGPSEPLAWTYYGEREGKAINVDMLKAMRLIEKLTGEKLVHTLSA